MAWTSCSSAAPTSSPTWRISLASSTKTGSPSTLVALGSARRLVGHLEQEVPLELRETRVFDAGCIFLRYSPIIDR